MRVGFGRRAVEQRGDLRVRIHRDEARAELLADVDRDDPRVVFGAGVALGEQLLEHHRDLHAVRRRQRIELKRVAADGQLLFVRRARDRAVDVREATAAFLVPGPNFRRRVGGRVGHGHELRSSLAAMGLFGGVRGGYGKGFFLRRDGLASRPMSYTFHLLPPTGRRRSSPRPRLPSGDEGAFLALDAAKEAMKLNIASAGRGYPALLGFARGL